MNQAKGRLPNAGLRKLDGDGNILCKVWFWYGEMMAPPSSYMTQVGDWGCV